MSILKMYRVLACGHLSERGSFISDLQHMGIMEISESVNDEKISNNEIAALFRKEDDRFKEIADLFSEMKRNLPGEGLLQKLNAFPEKIDKKEYEHLWDSDKTETVLERGKFLYRDLEKLNSDLAEIRTELALLSDYRNLDIDLKEIKKINSASLLLVRLNNENLEKIKSNEYIMLFSDYSENSELALILFHRSDEGAVREFMKNEGIVEEPLLQKYRNPSKSYDELFIKEKELLVKIRTSREDIKKYSLDNSSYIEKVLEYGKNLLARKKAILDLDTGASSFILKGWVGSDDVSLLHELQNKFSSIEIFTFKADEGESPPVKLINKKLYSPFQLIVRMYSMPGYGTIDPSRYTAFFFAFFLGITLTDAAYGLILMAFSALGLWKLKHKPDILWITLWGGLFTIVAGLLTGGIFGDLLRSSEPYVSMGALISVREFFMWFDPIATPMTFFRVVLLLGVIQILFGLGVSAVRSIRQGRLGDAIYDKLSWFVIVAFSVKILLSSKISVDMSLVPGSAPLFSDSYLLYEVAFPAAMALIILLFAGREEKSWPFRIFIGFLKLTVLSGIFSYLGDILSYIRLMALGMVTAGIGMAVNAIAFMTIDIPIVGILITGIIFIIGHLFNLGISIIGGFVHSLRLQYVEFYSKFFTGGGREFRPFSDVEEKIKISV